MTINEALTAISNYPIPPNVIAVGCIKGKLYGGDTVTAEIFDTLGYWKAETSVIEFLITAPQSVSQQGVSYSVGDSEKVQLRSRLSTLQGKIAATEAESGKAVRPTNVAFFGDRL